MKVLMFGWEFPPHILGGLGTASYGITKGLAEQGDMDITFCLPRPWGDEDKSFMNIIAMKSSFQIFVNAKLKTATMPGRTRGITTRKRAWVVVHPSIIAASSRLSGIRSKKLFAIIVQNARTVTMYMMLRTVRLSRCQVLIMYIIR